MKKLFIIAVILLSFYTLTYARSPEYEWTAQDTILQSSFTVVAVIDWLQTRYIATHPSRPGYNGYAESNPILGEHPSLKKVNLYFASCIIANAGISYLLPKPYRTIWQSISIGVEIDCTQYNYFAGVRLQF